MKVSNNCSIFHSQSKLFLPMCTIGCTFPFANNTLPLLWRCACQFWRELLWCTGNNYVHSCTVDAPVDQNYISALLTNLSSQPHKGTLAAHCTAQQQPGLLAVPKDDDDLGGVECVVESRFTYVTLHQTKNGGVLRWVRDGKCSTLWSKTGLF